MKILSRNLLLTLAMACPTGIAAAQDSTDSDRLDDVPEPPHLATGKSPGLKRQAGVGGRIAYAEAGVLELGGFGSFTSADDYTEVSVGPSIGYFFADNVQLSALAVWNYSEVENKQANNNGSFVVEPSLHVPLTDSTFLFGGLGVGGLFEKGEKPGAAIAPRIGYKNLTGRSGMLTFAVQSIFGLNETDVQTGTGTVLTVENAWGASLGYTVLL